MNFLSLFSHNLTASFFSLLLSGFFIVWTNSILDIEIRMQNTYGHARSILLDVHAQKNLVRAYGHAQIIVPSNSDVPMCVQRITENNANTNIT